MRPIDRVGIGSVQGPGIQERDGLESSIITRDPRGSAIMNSTFTAGQPIFQRVLLKLSGESFCRPGEGGINLEEVSRIARQAARVAARGVQLAIVVGGGNILRGAQLSRG